MISCVHRKCVEIFVFCVLRWLRDGSNKCVCVFLARCWHVITYDTRLISYLTASHDENDQMRQKTRAFFFSSFIIHFMYSCLISPKCHVSVAAFMEHSKLASHMTRPNRYNKIIQMKILDEIFSVKSDLYSTKNWRFDPFNAESSVHKINSGVYLFN